MAIGEKKLEAMLDAELELREKVLKSGDLYLGYHPLMREIHEKHADLIQAEVQSNGWSVFNKLKPSGLEALFVLCQHAISRPGFQKEAMTYFESLATKKGLEYAAYFADRIAFFERRPQRFGTQWDINLYGETELWPLESPDKLDERRALMHLSPFEDIDFGGVDMTFEVGLKRQLGVYGLIYEVGWLPCDKVEIKRIITWLSDYFSGAVLGPLVSEWHHKGGLDPDWKGLDLVVALHEKEDFEKYVLEKKGTLKKKGIKKDIFVIRDPEGDFELTVDFLEFSTDEEVILLAPLAMSVESATCHTPHGWLLTQEAIQKGRAANAF